MEILYAISIMAIVFFFMKQTGDKIIEDRKENIYPYKKKQYLLTIAEKNFYDVLKLAIEDTNYYICPMVRLADIIYVDKTDERQKYFNKIQSKHIDFLLCDADTLSPMIAIELDDSSHSQKDRKERDKFVDKALETVELEIIRFKARKSYNLNEIREKINYI